MYYGKRERFAFHEHDQRQTPASITEARSWLGRRPADSFATAARSPPDRSIIPIEYWCSSIGPTLRLLPADGRKSPIGLPPRGRLNSALGDDILVPCVRVYAITSFTPRGFFHPILGPRFFALLPVLSTTSTSCSPTKRDEAVGPEEHLGFEGERGFRSGGVRVAPRISSPASLAVIDRWACNEMRAVFFQHFAQRTSSAPD